jgi:NAD(P)-dependent dehydrogenase (short-subunit alcohol dehydrogenase family)
MTGPATRLPPEPGPPSSATRAGPGRDGESARTAPRSVFISGASSGIGRFCAEELHRLGWRVFAGVRTEEDAEELRAAGSSRLSPVLLDITDEAQIAAAVRFVAGELGDRGLDALINNAGIVVAGPLEFLPLDDFRRQFAVNVTGHLAVTQAMLGLLRRARGRIVMMSSASGRIALPFIGPYAASKMALEAVSDALRVELMPSGLSVSIIQPGPIATAMMERSIRAAEERFERMSPEASDLYRPMLEAARASALDSEKAVLPPEAVLRAVLHALDARRGKARYLVLRGGWLFRLATNLLPDRVLDAIILRVLEGKRPRRDAGAR